MMVEIGWWDGRWMLCNLNELAGKGVVMVGLGQE